MALLDHQVPADVKNVTSDLLQRCVGSVCVVKFVRDSLLVTAYGMVTELTVPENEGEDLYKSHIVLFTGLEHNEVIQASDVKYIYAPGMVPGMMSDLGDMMGPINVDPLRPITRN